VYVTLGLTIALVNEHSMIDSLYDHQSMEFGFLTRTPLSSYLTEKQFSLDFNAQMSLSRCRAV
jgi:hypothetical protein